MLCVRRLFWKFTRMKKIIFTILLITGTHTLFAQYLHYWDNSRPRYVQPAEKPAAPPAVENKPVEIIKPAPPAPLPLTAPVKIQATTLIASTTVPFNAVTGPPKFDRPPMIFHDWPDKCPAFTGALPVLNSYVPPEIALIITEKFEGHLYSISSYKGPDNQPQYKLKICSGGMIKYEYADAKGRVMNEKK